jgi:hypothetical protein
MGKTFKDMKKEGKVTLDGPKVKDRKAFAPSTRKHKAEKGKGSYNRKKPREEDAEFKKDETSEVKKADLERMREENKGKKLSPPEQAKLKKLKGSDFEMSEVKKADLERMRKENKGKKLSPPKQTKLKGGLQKTLKKELNESASIIKFIEAIMTEDHAKAHKYLKDTINKKIQEKISQEIEKPLF